MKTAYNKLSAAMSRYKIRGIYILILLYVAVVGILNPSFMTYSNWMNLLRQVAVYGIISCGITFVMLTGRTDLSAGMMLTFLCSLSVYFVVPGNDNQLLAILVPLALGAVFGLINGLLVGIIRLNSFVATLGMMSIYQGAVLLFTKKVDFLNANHDMLAFKFIGQGSVLGIPMPVIILLAVALICGLTLRKTTFGARIYAVGANPSNARFSGISPALIIVLAYVVAGLCTGMGSVVMCSRVMSAQPKMGLMYEFTALTAIVLGGLDIRGGKGTIFGTIIGVLILGIIDNSFTILGVNPFLQYIVKGIILVVAVVSQVMNDRGRSL